MLESFDETLWLNLTNIGLGIVTLICCVAVGLVFGKEFLVRARNKVRVPVLQDDHSFVFGDLGITMADGGKKIDEKEFALAYKNSNADEPNITRSDN
ncbi:MAG: hypothetical protein PHP42_03430 [Bacteroidota bacterium]|nr:hypothetical protein [Bacteroidota bacterium]